MNQTKTKVGVDKCADVLQGTFEHYYGMAMDHHTKAGTVSSILLGIVGAILVLVGFDEKVCGIVDAGSGLFVMAIGLFGAAWTWKQQERYYYWEALADKYQKELTKIWPAFHEFKTRDYYKASARDISLDKATLISAKTISRSIVRIHDRSLWVTLHIIVAAIGFGLLIVAAYGWACT